MRCQEVKGDRQSNRPRQHEAGEAEALIVGPNSRNPCRAQSPAAAAQLFRRNTNAALIPPNPNEFERITSGQLGLPTRLM